MKISIYTGLADKISSIMRTKKVDFNTAFIEAVQGRNLDWETTRREVGSILGKRPRQPRVTDSTEKLRKFLSRDSIRRDAARCEASLIAGVPAEDL